MRLEEASAVVREGFPAEYVDWMLAVTELGGTTVPLVLLAVLFWLAGIGGSGAVVAQLLESMTAVVPLLVGLYAALVAWIHLAPVAVARCPGTAFVSTV